MRKTNHQFIEEVIKPLSDARGVSGFEHEVAGLVEKLVQPYGVAARDIMQNVYLMRASNRRDARLVNAQATTGSSLREQLFPEQSGYKRPLRVQLDAHLDEVGFAVQSIRANGQMQIRPIGGWVAANVPAHRYRVLNRQGEWIQALTASKPPHYMSEEEKKQTLSLEQILLDVGASTREEVTDDYQIDVGAPIVPDVNCIYEAQHDLLLGKAFDCRLGCSALVRTLDLLRDEELSCDLVGAFSVQEEVGLRGAQVTVQRVQPDLAIVFEGSPADDSFLPADLSQTAIGRGPMLRHLDRSMMTHPGFQRFAINVAAESDIPIQLAVRSGGGNNAGPIHLANRGIPTVVISVPVRYVHTQDGYAKYRDVELAADLAAAIIRRLDWTQYEQLKDMR